MKIAVLSDTHIPVSARDLPQKVYEDLKSADLLLHAGDIVSVNFLNKLEAAVPQVRAVCGNMDEPDLRKILPLKRIVKVNKYAIGLIHGRGSPSQLLEFVKNEFSRERPDIIVFGHSHSPLNLKKDGTLFFNPGSPTDKVFAHANSYGIILIDDNIEAKIVTL